LTLVPYHLLSRLPHFQKENECLWRFASLFSHYFASSLFLIFRRTIPINKEFRLPNFLKNNYFCGSWAKWDKLREIAKDYNLRLIEDSSEALGAEYKGRHVGAFGKAGVFAFYPNKQITTSEGGVIVTDDEKIAGSSPKRLNIMAEESENGRIVELLKEMVPGCIEVGDESGLFGLICLGGEDKNES